MPDQDDSTTQPPSDNATPPANPLPEEPLEFDIIRQELEQSKAQLEQLTVISQQALADLQNYKRRTEEEKSAFICFANAELIKMLIPAIDNIHRALLHEPKDTEWTKGAEQTMRQLIEALNKIGLTQMETNGQKFDPNLHEALLTAPGEKDIVLQELEKGYNFKDKVIKRARVTVGDGEKQ